MVGALTAMGQLGLELVLDAMNTGYGKPIYSTGDLQRSISFDVDAGKQTTIWGSNLDYAIPVHEGTPSMLGRPFFIDGLLENKDMLQQIAADELKKGF